MEKFRTNVDIRKKNNLYKFCDNQIWAWLILHQYSYNVLTVQFQWMIPYFYNWPFAFKCTLLNIVNQSLNKNTLLLNVLSDFF